VFSALDTGAVTYQSEGNTITLRSAKHVTLAVAQAALTALPSTNVNTASVTPEENGLYSFLYTSRYVGVDEAADPTDDPVVNAQWWPTIQATSYVYQELLIKKTSDGKKYLITQRKQMTEKTEYGTNPNQILNTSLSAGGVGASMDKKDVNREMFLSNGLSLWRVDTTVIHGGDWEDWKEKVVDQ
jgi:hypothetical protein